MHFLQGTFLVSFSVETVTKTSGLHIKVSIRGLMEGGIRTTRRSCNPVSTEVTDHAPEGGPTAHRQYGV